MRSSGGSTFCFMKTGVRTEQVFCCQLLRKIICVCVFWKMLKLLLLTCVPLGYLSTPRKPTHRLKEYANSTLKGIGCLDHGRTQDRVAVLQTTDLPCHHSLNCHTKLCCEGMTKKSLSCRCWQSCMLLWLVNEKQKSILLAFVSEV